MSESELFSEPSTLSILFYSAIILTCVVVISGNLLVIATLLLQRKLRTPPNMYLGSLALIDLGVGVFILPVRIAQVMHNNEWEFGPTLCNIFVTADVTLCTLSIYHLVAIGWDRYQSIAQGVAYVQSRSFTTVSITIFFLWIISLWISTPPILGWHNEDFGYQHIEGQIHCVLTRNKGYVFHSTLGSFILPMGIISVLYYKIYTGIKEKLRKRRLRPESMLQGSSYSKDKLSTQSDYSDTDRSSEDILEMPKSVPRMRAKSLPKKMQFRVTWFRKNSTDDKVEDKCMEENERPRAATLASSSPYPRMSVVMQKKIKFSLSKERRIVKTVGVITGAFFLCWLPFSSMYLTDAFVYPMSETVWFEIASWLGYVNSAMNPFIYGIFHTEFRKAFSSTFKMCKLKR